MPRIVALFSEIDSLEEARTKLEEAGFGEDVQRVIDRSTVDRTATGGPQPPSNAAGARHDGTLLGFGRTTPTGDEGTIDGLGLDDEEADFLRDSVDDGARVLVVDTDARRAPEALTMLRAHAQRVLETG